MKLNKATTVLLNLVLILCVAFLFKMLLSYPKALSAATPLQYKVIQTGKSDEGAALESLMNKLGQDGWHFVGNSARLEYLFFEK